MTDIDDLTLRNRAFATTSATQHLPAIPFVPNRQVYVVTCIDPRVDPADILGLELGDAIVARTVGGRVTPAVLADIAWISFLHEVKTPDAGWFEVMVIHHTDCGSGFFADDELRTDFATRGFDADALRALAVLDPSTTVARDVDLLRAYPNLDERVRVGGYAYDTATGILTEIAAPGARADARS